MIRIVLWLALAAVLTTPSRADVRWRSLDPVEDRGDVCLVVEGSEIDYARLEETEPVVIRLRGPRRVKILVRQLFGATGEEEHAFVLHAAVDGTDVLNEVFRGGPRPVTACDDTLRAGRLHRAYVDVPAGWHDVSVFAEGETEHGAAARFFRETRRRSDKLVSYAPEGYDTVTHLQFDSGSRSAYYTFTVEHPLVCEVAGPTTLTVWTRLDFDHTMSGVQPYALDVLVDGEIARTLHYDSEKLDAAVYVDRPGVLPGERRTFELPLEKGRHRVEIRCVRPESCCLAGKIRIPEDDLDQE